jgi:hypothetical protein
MKEVLFSMTLWYLVPLGITLYHSVQTKSEILAIYAITPLINILGAFISIGEMIFKFLT